jgi:phytoene/squalene synthetase
VNDGLMGLVRDQDRARYLTTLYAPADKREKLWALHAFNVELSRVRELTSEPMLGEIRLTWWREAVEEAYAGQPRAHPVVKALLSVTDTVPRALLEEMIEGRFAEMSEDVPDMAALLAYARQTGGAQNAAAAHILGEKYADLGTVARDVGAAWSLVGLLRAIQFHAAHAQVYLPRAELQALGLTREEIFQRPLGQDIVPLVMKIADEAHTLLRSMRTNNKQPNAVLAPCYMLGTLATDYLRMLQRADHDVTRVDLERGDLRRQLKLVWANLTSNY